DSGTFSFTGTLFNVNGGSTMSLTKAGTGRFNMSNLGENGGACTLAINAGAIYAGKITGNPALTVASGACLDLNGPLFDPNSSGTPAAITGITLSGGFIENSGGGLPRITNNGNVTVSDGAVSNIQANLELNMNGNTRTYTLGTST